MLREIKPSLALILVGLSNMYGHPTKEVLSLLQKYAVKILRTDKNGEIEVISDGNSYQVYTN